MEQLFKQIYNNFLFSIVKIFTLFYKEILSHNTDTEKISEDDENEEETLALESS